MHKLKTLLSLAIVAAVVLSSSALAAPSSGYKGKIEYQGLRGDVQGLQERQARDGSRRADARRLRRRRLHRELPHRTEGKLADQERQGVRQAHRPFDQSKATVELKGSVKGGTFKGFVREVDFVEGSGIVCDTLERKFTAKRG
jgi:hypothetical protein